MRWTVIVALALLASGARAQVLSVELPFGDRQLPAGPNMETVTNNRTACHSVGMILTQPKLSAATWTAEVNKMRSVYKAPVPEEDVAPIVEYLAAMKVGS